MPAPCKLSDVDVVNIRRRVEGGEQLSVLAVEFGVNRKTLRRRLDALELAAQEEARRVARTRLERQIARERRKLKRRDAQVASDAVQTSVRGSTRTSKNFAYLNWLDRRKNLAGRAFAEANGRVGIRTPDGKNHHWVDRPDVERWLEEGWVLA